VWVLLAAQSALIIYLSRTIRKMLPEAPPELASLGLSVGSPVPETEVEDINCVRICLGGQAPQRRLLVFLSTGCPSCQSALNLIENRSYAIGVQIVLIWNTDLVGDHSGYEEPRVIRRAVRERRFPCRRNCMSSI
jgi:hypothetical protein